MLPSARHPGLPGGPGEPCASSCWRCALSLLLRGCCVRSTPPLPFLWCRTPSLDGRLAVPCPKRHRPQHWLGLSSSTSNPGPCLHNRRFSLPRPVPAAHGLLPRTVMPRAGRPSEGREERGILPTPCWLEGLPAGSLGTWLWSGGCLSRHPGAPGP